MKEQLALCALEGEFAVCRLTALPDVQRLKGTFFLSVTAEEISLVCETGQVPAGEKTVERGFRAFRVGGALDFSLVGILAGISGTLAESGISLFAVSTYDTDYVLVRSEAFENACAALRKAGYQMAEQSA